MEHDAVELAESRSGWILLAEDDEDVRRLISVALRGDGYAVTEARDGRELGDRLDACQRGEGPEPDVIIADVKMPHFTATEVLGDARRAALKVPVVLITAHWDLASCADVYGLHAAAIFAKPFDLDVLLTAVANLASSRPAEG